jgi:hypothetical protein
LLENGLFIFCGSGSIFLALVKNDIENHNNTMPIGIKNIYTNPPAIPYCPIAGTHNIRTIVIKNVDIKNVPI